MIFDLLISSLLTEPFKSSESIPIMRIMRINRILRASRSCPRSSASRWDPHARRRAMRRAAIRINWISWLSRTFRISRAKLNQLDQLYLLSKYTIIYIYKYTKYNIVPNIYIQFYFMFYMFLFLWILCIVFLLRANYGYITCHRVRSPNKVTQTLGSAHSRFCCASSLSLSLSLSLSSMARALLRCALRVALCAAISWLCAILSMRNKLCIYIYIY